MDRMSYVVIIPAAGESQRFKDAGIKKPKGLLQLEYKGRRAPMIAHCIPNNFVGEVIVAIRYLPVWAVAGVSRFFVVNETLGQADTVRQAAETVDGHIVVINSDNHIDIDMDLFVANCVHKNADAGAVVFDADFSLKYGYVDAYPDFKVGAEKRPISPYALAGAFYYRNGRVLIDAFNMASMMSSTNEIYLSHLFEHIPGRKVGWLIPKDKLHEWGTPIDLMADPAVKITDSDWEKRL